MKIGSLFSGIGGLDLGLERAGLGHVVWQAERDTYCQAVLRRHWPDAVIYDDVRRIDERAARVDVLCGGFPCQPVSLAGARLAQADERWLWPEFVRIARALNPAVVIVENVPGLRSAGLRDVLADLAALGFDAEWTCLAAGEDPQRTHGWPHVGAPHERRRIFLVATHPDRAEVREQPGWLSRSCWEGARVTRHARKTGPAANADRVRELQQSGRLPDFGGWASDSGWRHAPPAIRGVDDGTSARLDSAIGNDAGGDRDEARESSQAPDSWRVAACGNAVLPQCAELIGRAVVSSVEFRA